MKGYNVYVGSLNDIIDISVGNRLKEISVRINNLPIRKSISVCNKLILSAQNALVDIYRYVYPVEQTLSLKSTNINHTSKTIFERLYNVVNMAHDARFRLNKSVGVKDTPSAIISPSSVTATLMVLAALYEIDAKDGVCQSLNDIDNLKLSDLDGKIV